MNRIRLAQELVRLAKVLVAIEFDTEEEKKQYQRKHKVRKDTKLTVKKTKSPSQEPRHVGPDKELPWKTPDAKTKRRLEHLRKELESERISYGELVELQGLAEYIDPDDVQLLEAAGVPEGTRRRRV